MLKKHLIIPLNIGLHALVMPSVSVTFGGSHSCATNWVEHASSFLTEFVCSSLLCQCTWSRLFLVNLLPWKSQTDSLPSFQHSGVSVWLKLSYASSLTFTTFAWWPGRSRTSLPHSKIHFHGPLSLLINKPRIRSYLMQPLPSETKTKLPKQTSMPSGTQIISMLPHLTNHQTSLKPDQSKDGSCSACSCPTSVFTSPPGKESRVPERWSGLHALLHTWFSPFSSSRVWLWKEWEQDLNSFSNQTGKRLHNLMYGKLLPFRFFSPQELVSDHLCITDLLESHKRKFWLLLSGFQLQTVLPHCMLPWPFSLSSDMFHINSVSQSTKSPIKEWTSLSLPIQDSWLKWVVPTSGPLFSSWCWLPLVLIQYSETSTSTRPSYLIYSQLFSRKWEENTTAYCWLASASFAVWLSPTKPDSTLSDCSIPSPVVYHCFTAYLWSSSSLDGYSESISLVSFWKWELVRKSQSLSDGSSNYSSQSSPLLWSSSTWWVNSQMRSQLTETGHGGLPPSEDYFSSSQSVADSWESFQLLDTRKQKISMYLLKNNTESDSTATVTLITPTKLSDFHKRRRQKKLNSLKHQRRIISNECLNSCEQFFENIYRLISLTMFKFINLSIFNNLFYSFK